MLWAVIMAGGSGTRFWPESRRQNPKQFLKIFGKKTLLQQTVDRLRSVIPPSRIIVVTQQNKTGVVKKLLPSVPSAQIIGEPVGRNTAPCAILAAAYMVREDPDAVLALLPADHLIEKKGRFQALLKKSYCVAQKEKMPVTFGIRPHFPHTGYGYLEMNRRSKSGRALSVCRLKRFHEKPSFKRAQKFLRTGRFLWNSGMFVWRAESLLQAARKYLPKVKRHADYILAKNFKKRMKRYFGAMQDISIDYGLMEKMRGKILTIPVDLGWNDVGGWQSIEELYPSDSKKNVILGSALCVDSSGNIIKSQQGRLVALLGVQDHVIVDTPDALLVCPKGKTESIRSVVKKLKTHQLKKYL